MRIRGLGRVRLWRDRIRNRLSPGAIILLYHRVASLPPDPQMLCVSPENFAQHLEVIRRLSQPFSLQSLPAALTKRKVPTRGVAITFDDGAADNLYAAKPLLDKHDVPATMFVATGYMKSGREYWWDELERLFLRPAVLPQRLALTIRSELFEWQLDRANHADQANGNSRDALYRRMIELLLPLEPSERFDLLDQLKEWANDTTLARDTHRPLRPDEVRELAAGGVEIGAHTVTHSMLSALPEKLQRTEIETSKRDLQDVLDRPIESFAYPFGTLSDYTPATVAILRESGFQYACSNFFGVVLPGADRLQLPRILVRDWPGDEFEKRLEKWFRS